METTITTRLTCIFKIVSDSFKSIALSGKDLYDIFADGVLLCWQADMSFKFC
jgi:hypothetical protein